MIWIQAVSHQVPKLLERVLAVTILVVLFVEHRGRVLVLGLRKAVFELLHL